jgi:hypothetical protein
VRRVVHRLGCPSHEDVSPGPDQVPVAWQPAPAFHLAPMPFAIQARLVERLRQWGGPGITNEHRGAGGPGMTNEHRGAGGPHISIDPHEPITEASLPRWRDVLAHADAFFPSEDELRLDDAQTDPHASLRRLAAGRLRFVFYKRGLKGGILYDAREDRFHDWAARTHGVVDPTGAGDAFAAGFLGAHLGGLSVAEGLQRGVVGASFAIQAWGPGGLLDATRADAEARLDAWFGREATT